MKKTLFLILSLVCISFGCTKSSDVLLSEIQVQPRTTYTISGTIRWEHDDVTGVNNVTVNLSGSEVQSTTTDINGNYSFSVSTLATYTVTPSKLTNLTNGCDSADASIIQNHIAFMTAINDPYKRVAADANKNNFLSTIDASIILQAKQGNPQALSILSPSWRFVDASYILTLPVNYFAVPSGFPQSKTFTISGNTSGIDFVGIKRGDVNGSTNPGL